MVFMPEQKFRALKTARQKGSPSLEPVSSTIFVFAYSADHGLERDVTILSMGSAETRLAGLATGTIDAATLIAPLTFKAKDMGLKELVFFGDLNFLLPGGAILVREDLLRTDPNMVERFIRASLMGFRFLRENPAAPTHHCSTLTVDEALGAKMYESAKPTMTAGADLSDDAQKKMIALIMKLAGIKDGPPVERLFDFSFLRKAHATLQARGWKPRHQYFASPRRIIASAEQDRFHSYSLTSRPPARCFC